VSDGGGRGDQPGLSPSGVPDDHLMWNVVSRPCGPHRRKPHRRHQHETDEGRPERAAAKVGFRHSWTVEGRGLTRQPAHP
jgi:hypothetical protein